MASNLERMIETTLETLCNSDILQASDNVRSNTGIMNQPLSQTLRNFIIFDLLSTIFGLDDQSSTLGRDNTFSLPCHVLTQTVSCPVGTRW